MNFLEHAQAHGLVVRHVIQDGRWHRVPTTDKPRKKNGAYLFDGTQGVVKNWATMEGFSVWKDGSVTIESRKEFAQRAREVARKQRDTERKRHGMAAAEAARMLSEAEISTHGYLARKGFPGHQAMVRDGMLLVPMRDWSTNQLLSVQTIAEDGTKLFLPGGRAKGAIFRMGPERFSELWFVEGYATGLSVQAALRDMRRSKAAVVVCFSADNLRRIAGSAGFGAVIADNDASLAGQKAAQGSGRPWAMPGEVGMDANDLHVAKGLRAVVRLILEAEASM